MHFFFHLLTYNLFYIFTSLFSESLDCGRGYAITCSLCHCFPALLVSVSQVRGEATEPDRGCAEGARGGGGGWGDRTERADRLWGRGWKSSAEPLLHPESRPVPRAVPRAQGLRGEQSVRHPWYTLLKKYPTKGIQPKLLKIGKTDGAGHTISSWS